MKRLMRLLSVLFLLAAFILLVIDGTTAIAARQVGFTALGELLIRLLPQDMLARWSAAMSEAVHPVIWEILTQVLFNAPALIVFMALALALWMAGRAEEPDMRLRLR